MTKGQRSSGPDADAHVLTNLCACLLSAALPPLLRLQGLLSVQHGQAR